MQLSVAHFIKRVTMTEEFEHPFINKLSKITRFVQKINLFLVQIIFLFVFLMIQFLFVDT